MITKYDFEQCKTLDQARRLAFEWFDSLTTYRDALDLCSRQLLNELMPDGATLDSKLRDNPYWLEVRQRVCINIFAGWERRQRNAILARAADSIAKEVAKEFAASGIKHAGEQDIQQMLRTYMLTHLPNSEAIFDLMVR
jgi:hypothetical protein